MRVVVVGAGRLGQEMTSALTADSNDVTLVDIDREHVAWLQLSPKARVIHGDGCDPVVLEEAGALKADVLVAVAGEDQVNLVVCLLAKRQFDVPRVVARVNEKENHWLFNEHWGVDVAVSASATLLSQIQEATSMADTVGLLRLGRAGVGLFETTLTAQSRAVGKALSELSLPAGSMVAAVLRGGRPSVPGGSFTLEAGDEVIVISDAATEADIRNSFQR